MRPMRSRLIVLGLAVIVVVIAIVASSGGGGGGGGGGGQIAPKGALQISFLYSPGKEKLLLPLVREVNDQKKQGDGQPGFVGGKTVSSGEEEKEIDQGPLRPT